MPNASEGRMADDLVDLTEALEKAGWDSFGGGLGGTYGYGTNYENDVFEMHPFWWGDCECGHEQREAEWGDANPHATHCYQTALEARGGYDHARELAAEWGLSEWGCAIHCTCGHDARYATWRQANTHDPKCGIARPNFLHKASNTRVDWYKYIGRGMEFQPVEKKAWARLIQECTDSITPNPDYVEPEPREPMTDAEMEQWAKDNIYVFEGSLPEVMQQVDETFHPVAAIQRLDDEF